MCARVAAHRESEPRVGYDAQERKHGSKSVITVDAMGLLLAVYITPANAEVHFAAFVMLMLVQVKSD